MRSATCLRRISVNVNEPATGKQRKLRVDQYESRWRSNIRSDLNASGIELPDHSGSYRAKYAG